MGNQRISGRPFKFGLLVFPALLAFGAAYLPNAGRAGSKSYRTFKRVWCRGSLPEQNLVYFNLDKMPPRVDIGGFAWNQAEYTLDARWVEASKVTQLPPEWEPDCGPAWISSIPSGLSAPGVDTYYRNLFDLPRGASIQEAWLTFSADDGADVWLNGMRLDKYSGSLTSPDATRNYHICNSLAIPGTRFHPGPNVLAFRVPNLMSYEGLNYTLCLVGTTKPH